MGFALIAACVVDASIAIKWVITEPGTEAALRLRADGTECHAPDVLLAECGNIVWRKVQRNELTPEEAAFACQILGLADIRLHPTQDLLSQALDFSIQLGHALYDTLALALARQLCLPFVTADRRLMETLAASAIRSLPETLLLS